MDLKRHLHVNSTYSFCIMCRRFTNIKILHTLLLCYSNSLQAGWCRDGVPFGSKFSTPPFRTALGPNQPPIQWVPCFFPIGKVAGVWP